MSTPANRPSYRPRDYVTSAVCILALLIVWEAAVSTTQDAIIPGPIDSSRALLELAKRGTLAADAFASLQRVVIGFVLAAIIGTLLGLGIGLFRSIRISLTPIINLLRPIPPIAWIPLAIILFGIGNKSAYFVIFLGAIFPVLTNSAFGVHEVLPIYLDAAKVLGASRWQSFIHVTWPGSLPSIFTGFRVGLGFAWMCVIAAEMIASSSGLGYSIQQNRVMFRLDRVVAYMVTVGIFGFLMNMTLLWVEKRLLPWRKPKPLSGGESVHQIGSSQDLDMRLDGTVATGLAISMREVEFAYPNELPVVRGCNLDIPTSEVFCIVGTSGCGKTTILKLLASLEYPRSGEIRVEGQLLSEQQQNVTMVFQGYALFPWKTAISNIMFGLAVHKVPQDRQKDIATQYLEIVGLERLANHYPHQLSGGQQQRVALARALAIQPRVLLLDEPFTALDIQTRAELQAEVASILARLKVTVVMVTHDIDEAIYMADRIAVMTPSGKLLGAVAITNARPRSRSFLDEPVIRMARSTLEKILHDGDAEPKSSVGVQ